MNTINSSTQPPRDAQTRTKPIERNAMIGFVLTVGIAALAAWLMNVGLPRGPTTQTQALFLLISGLLIGLAGGLLTRSPWAMLVVPVVHILVLEFSRPHLLGPTVGAIRLNELYGILAFVLGRGLYGLIGILPMILGAYLGLVIGNQMVATTPSTGNAVVRWFPTVLASLILVALAIWIAFPARTPAILGTDGKLLAGSIAELTTVKLGGQDQAIMIRAYNPNKPVLLYLNGGPGQSGLAYSRVMLEDLSRDFVIVDWDQRGTGKSYAAFEPSETLTLEQAINDTIELAKYLRQRFTAQKIYLLGESWGTTLGVLAVQRQPELFHAFIGSGQMVSQRETDRRLYQDVLDLAAKTGNTQLATKMQSYGQPPYADIPYANAFVMGQYEALYKPYIPSQAYMDRGNNSGVGFYGVLASEYNLIEKFNVLRGLIDMFTVMYPQLQGIDFRKNVKKLDVPIYVLDGTSELSARRDLMLEWFKALEAPKKQLFTFNNAAHSVAFEQFETFDKIMLETVLPETYLTH
jgi:proline iminopeptidase